jgi:hypoxanthine phosphoribosyltransferase
MSDAFRFAHPAEAEFARLLDFYGVRWEYEPRSFVLERDPDGRPIRSFAPDFYLPDQELYVELTTMSARLTYRKTRKVRLLRQLYPEIRIKLFDRRDLRSLMLKYDRSLE